VYAAKLKFAITLHISRPIANDGNPMVIQMALLNSSIDLAHSPDYLSLKIQVYRKNTVYI